MQNWLFELAQNFIIGGLVITSVSYLGTFLDPVLAAIWWAFPISLIPSMYYMHQQGKTFKYISQFSYTTTYALIILFVTTMMLGYFYRRETSSFWIPVFKSAGVWAVLSAIYYISIKSFGLGKYFM